jgi:hypothetical protein
MKSLVAASIIILPACFVSDLQAQGCSDAGFCTIGNLAQQNGKNEYNNKITVQLPVGLGDEEVFIFAPAVQYDHSFNRNWAFQGKLTANYADGNLGSVAGIGDLYLSATHTFPAKGKWNWSATLGTKLPLNQSNLKADGLSLPMQYQSSLGTVDLISGLSVSNANWQFAAGWQQPLTGTNGNNFLPIYRASGSKAEEAAAYIPSNDFNRRADVLLRGLYRKQINQKFSFNAGLLGIYHLDEDTYIDGSVSSKPIEIKGSKGLTLNASAAGWLKLNKKTTLGLTVAIPLLVRDLRPDGLTRSFVFSPEISWNF